MSPSIDAKRSAEAEASIADLRSLLNDVQTRLTHLEQREEKFFGELVDRFWGELKEHKGEVGKKLSALTARVDDLEKHFDRSWVKTQTARVALDEGLAKRFPHKSCEERREIFREFCRDNLRAIGSPADRRFHFHGAIKVASQTSIDEYLKTDPAYPADPFEVWWESRKKKSYTKRARIAAKASWSTRARSKRNKTYGF